MYMNNCIKGKIWTCNFFPSENCCALGFNTIPDRTQTAEIVLTSSLDPPHPGQRIIHGLDTDKQTLILFLYWESVQWPAQCCPSRNSLQVLRAITNIADFQSPISAQCSKSIMTKLGGFISSSFPQKEKRRGEHRRKWGWKVKRQLWEQRKKEKIGRVIWSDFYLPGNEINFFNKGEGVI